MHNTTDFEFIYKNKKNKKLIRKLLDNLRVCAVLLFVISE